MPLPKTCNEYQEGNIADHDGCSRFSSNSGRIDIHCIPSLFLAWGNAALLLLAVIETYVAVRDCGLLIRPEEVTYKSHQHCRARP
ncbi:hypothetical protein LshimejAT787_0206080 [Lyophyllum shimeji]|uniref:Uncharacterized protein n=1 Tax=Lyophyllum shimeji TaxID=47721 RepID=A0A9P3PGJ8_LYOSH|nr:hypothetical protein LshimejAT787_0206080 [Lyophyllum shimeji]